jgi:FkbM family methyltransferase
MRAKEVLQSLLSETPGACRERERNTFDEIVAGKNLVLFGAGGLGRKALAALLEDGIVPLAFIDNKLAGRLVDGIEVLSPVSAAEKWGRSAAFVVTIWASWADTMHEQIGALRNLGCETVVPFIPLLWKYQHLLPHVQIDLPSRVLEQNDRVLEGFNLCSDQSSRDEFVAQLRWRLRGEFEGLMKPLSDQYFQPDLVELNNEAVFADAGAFDGDTLARFVSYTRGQFRAAYLFEPDSENRRSIQGRLNSMPEEIRGRVRIFAAAVAEGEYEVPFQGGLGASSSPGVGPELVSCVTMDQALPESPTLIKYDIEGFELLGLAGSRRIITENSPALAVCAYHVQNHLWEIPLLVHSFNKNYRFFLRSHGQIWETVWYAIPVARP